jgi:hypothetical protein
MTDPETCDDCGEDAPKGTDSEGRCRHCSPYWPKREQTEPDWVKSDWVK